MSETIIRPSFLAVFSGCCNSFREFFPSLSAILVQAFLSFHQNAGPIQAFWRPPCSMSSAPRTNPHPTHPKKEPLFFPALVFLCMRRHIKCVNHPEGPLPSWGRGLGEQRQVECPHALRPLAAAVPSDVGAPRSIGCGSPRLPWCMLWLPKAISIAARARLARGRRDARGLARTLLFGWSGAALLLISHSVLITHAFAAPLQAPLAPSRRQPMLMRETEAPAGSPAAPLRNKKRTKAGEARRLRERSAPPAVMAVLASEPPSRPSLQASWSPPSRSPTCRPTSTT